MVYGEKMNEFQKSLAGANYEQLLLSSQVMLCELARRHLEARLNAKESPGTANNTGSPKLPTLVEVQNAFVKDTADTGYPTADEFGAIEFTFDYICRQLRASA